MYPKGYLTYTNFTAIVYPRPTCHTQAAGPTGRTLGRQSSEGWPPRAPARVSAPEGPWGRQPCHRTVSSRLQSWRRKGGREGTKPLVPAGGSWEAGACIPPRCPCPPWPFEAELIKQHSVRRARQRLHPLRERSVRTTEHTTGTRSYIHRTETAAGARRVHSASLSFSLLDQRVKEQLLETTGRPRAASRSACPSSPSGVSSVYTRYLQRAGTVLTSRVKSCKESTVTRSAVVACWLAACLRRRGLSGLEESELSHYCTTELCFCCPSLSEA